MPQFSRPTWGMPRTPRALGTRRLDQLRDLDVRHAVTRQRLDLPALLLGGHERRLLLRQPFFIDDSGGYVSRAAPIALVRGALEGSRASSRDRCRCEHLNRSPSLLWRGSARGLSSERAGEPGRPWLNSMHLTGRSSPLRPQGLRRLQELGEVFRRP